LSRRAAALALAALAAAGCAGVRPAAGAAGFRFPESFDATQAVTVDAPDGKVELLASLRRRGADYEVTLFDPVFATPLLGASLSGGVFRVDASGPGVTAREAERLVEVLRDVYAGSYPLPVSGTTVARGHGIAITLTDVDAGAPCPFAGRIDVRPRFGAAPAVAVRTLDVSCATPSAPPAPAGGATPR
jgi:hypothetical protein